MADQIRRPRTLLKRKRLRVAVLYNVDFADSSPEGDPGWVARAEVESVATRVVSDLREGGVEADLVPVDGDLVKMRDRLGAIQPDCVFNLCESLAGDARLESATPLLVELLGYVVTGSPAEVLSRALYKDRVKDVLRRAGVPTPESTVLVRADDRCDLPFPLIVKPTREDGSVGIHSRGVVHDERGLRAIAGELIATYHQPCLVERFIEGRELNVSLLGYPSARVLPLSEIDFSSLPAGAPRIVSYDAKWREESAEFKGTTPVLHPVLPTNVAARVRRVALEAFRAVGLRDYGRVDIRLATDGTPWVVDVNPNCDLSADAGLARSAAAVGIDHAALVRLLVRYALRRRAKESRDDSQDSRIAARRSIAPG